MKIAAIGGGTGLSTMLRGLKRISPSITAIVTVMDNGGGSGVLRQELGMLPPGDIRNCLQALANTEPTMGPCSPIGFRTARCAARASAISFSPRSTACATRSTRLSRA